jgi:uncharacterized membrane protein (DUF2068 family)
LNPSPPPPTHAPHIAAARGIRVVAVLEAGKGILVLLVGFGLLAFLHDDVETVAANLLLSLHLNPAKRIPRIFLEVASHFSDVQMWLLAALAFLYAAMRLAVAWGLWFGRRWAEWLAVSIGGIYIPFEVYALIERTSSMTVVTQVLNILVVAYLGGMLWREREQHARRSG